MCLERDVDVRFETVTLAELLVATAGASLRLVILDACRNNPLACSMQRTAATRSVSGGSFGDLNEDLPGGETLVAYAAVAGTTAADGRYFVLIADRPAEEPEPIPSACFDTFTFGGIPVHVPRSRPFCLHRPTWLNLRTVPPCTRT